MEASSLTGDNVLKLFSDAAKFLYTRFGQEDDLTDNLSDNSWAAGGSTLTQNDNQNASVASADFIKNTNAGR